MTDGLGLDAWWDEPAYHLARDTFTKCGPGLCRAFARADLNCRLRRPYFLSRRWSVLRSTPDAWQI